jgi:hypothetical protein
VKAHPLDYPISVYGLFCGRFGTEIRHRAASELAAAAIASFDDTLASASTRRCFGRNIGCWEIGIAPPFKAFNEPSKRCFMRL